jgi:ABC-type Fe3+-siderophore transport system permease subunit
MSVSAQQLSEVLTSYFYFYVRFRVAIVGGPYFLLLFLRPFSRSNCRRSLLLLLLGPFPRSNYRRSLLLTFTFTSVFAQQLPEVLISYFYFYVRFRAATAGGPYFLLLLLGPFPRSNCRRSLLLTFTFTFVSAQQLPEVLTSYFYFYIRFCVATTGGPYFLLLLLRPFSRSNCRRSLLLTFIFTSVSAQQLSLSSMGEVFL